MPPATLIAAPCTGNAPRAPHYTPVRSPLHRTAPFHYARYCAALYRKATQEGEGKNDGKEKTKHTEYITE